MLNNTQAAEVFTEFYADFSHDYDMAKDGQLLTFSDFKNVPEPYDKQIDIMASTAPRKVVSAGRRSGKTVLAGLIALDGLLHGQRVFYGSISQEQSDAVWDYLTQWCFAELRQLGFYINESRRIIDGRFIKVAGAKYGRIRVKTASEPKHLRGDHADILILDECSFLPRAAWDQVGAPMLTDNAYGGTAYFFSTPNHKNWFYDLFMRGEEDAVNEDGVPFDEWHNWHFTTQDNPHLTQAAFDLLVKDMTKKNYKQEILAKFSDNDGQVFKNIEALIYGRMVGKQGWSDYVFGIDWAKRQDFTVITVIDRRTGQVVEIERMNKIDYRFQLKRLKALATMYDPYLILAEANSMGEPLIESLWYDGLPVIGFNSTNQSKRDLIEGLVLSCEQKTIALPQYTELLKELAQFQYNLLPSGRVRFEAPEGKHDDCVISLALANHARRVPPSVVASLFENETMYLDINAAVDLSI